MKNIAVIPARGGSKRVPDKNIRELGGLPLIVHTIRAAQNSRYLDRIVVSTDSQKIAEIATSYGAEVPFLRPTNLSEDTTPDQPVLKHVVEAIGCMKNDHQAVILNLRPTSPFKTSHTIDRVIEAINDAEVDIVRTMTLVDGVHHPYWMYRIDKNGRTVPFVSGIDIKKYYQRQLLPSAYRINGVVDAYKLHVIQYGDILSNENLKAVLISEEESIDIDTEFDFKLCEALIKLKFK